MRSATSVAVFSAMFLENENCENSLVRLWNSRNPQKQRTNSCAIAGCAGSTSGLVRRTASKLQQCSTMPHCAYALTQQKWNARAASSSGKLSLSSVSYSILSAGMPKKQGCVGWLFWKLPRASCRTPPPVHGTDTAWSFGQPHALYILTQEPSRGPHRTNCGNSVTVSYKPTRPHAHTHACTHARMHACTHARMHACTHARMHACTHTHTHSVTCFCEAMSNVYALMTIT